MVPIYEPDVKRYGHYAIQAIKDGWVSNHGEYVSLSTNKLKEITGTKHAILMCNGTVATHCMFISLKYKYPNIQKIYVPNNCYVAAWNALLMEYHTEVIEVMKMDIDTWNVSDDIQSLEPNSAVLIVHNIGNIVNVPRLKTIRPDLIFMEDNCEGLFGLYGNTYSGTSDSSLCSSCSFYGNKTITSGEGGAFFTQDSGVYEYIKSVYSQGLSNKRYLHDIHAYNYRMTNVQAGLLYAQLEDLDTILGNKRRVFEVYEKFFVGKYVQQVEPGTKRADWMFAIRIKNNPFTHDETYNFFSERGVDMRPFFYPINSHGHLESIKSSDEVATQLNRDVIMIPSSPRLALDDQYKVIKTVIDFEVHTRGFYIIQDDIKKYINFMKNDPFFRYFKNRPTEPLKNHVYTMVILNRKGDFVGYGHIDYEIHDWIGVYVAPVYRQTGVGQIILNHLIYKAHVRAIKELHLTVDYDNVNAKKLYCTNGFKSSDGKHFIREC